MFAIFKNITPFKKNLVIVILLLNLLLAVLGGLSIAENGIVGYMKWFIIISCAIPFLNIWIY